MGVSTSDPYEDPDLPALVSAALEIRDQGLDRPLEDLCKDRPDLLEAVALSVESSLEIPALQRLSESEDRLSGTVLDSRYRLESRLGAGAMGVVYRGEDLELRRPVAIKILRATFLDGEEAAQRFAREAQALAAIDHPAVVAIHDVGRTPDGAPYLAMELLEGAPLGRILEDGERIGVANDSQDTGWVATALGVESIDEPSYLRAAVRWTADLASGLCAAHEKGIFHRDVKPSNVFVRRDGRPVLLDFGIAARVSHAALTREGSPLGTPAYMAPESLSQDSVPSAALDVYGLAATLYHVLTLRPPYRGTPTQIFANLVAKSPRPVQKLRAGLPRDLAAIVSRGMARRPSERYTSAAALQADLRAFLDYRPVQARPLAPWVRAWRWARRSPAFLVGAAMVVLLLAGFGGAQWRSSWLDGRAAAHLELWRRVPPTLGIVNVRNREFSDLEGRDEIGALLDDAAELCADPLPTLLLRAAFRLDHGDAAGAGRDMTRIAESVGSPYARALAARYRALPAGTSSAYDLDTADLPEPDGRLDLYLAAFHLFRADRSAESTPLLADERLAEYVPAQELLTLRLAGDPHRMYERAVWLEERIGRRTATTSHLLGLALFLQGRSTKSYEVFREGIELAPKSYVLEENAGWIAWRMGNPDQARVHLRKAIALKPQHAKPHETLVRVLMDVGELDLASAALEAAPFDTSDGWRRKRMILSGDIETERALRTRDAAGSLTAAENAVAYYDDAAQLGAPVESAAASISRAIVRGEAHPVFAGLLELLEEEPLNERRIEILLDWMPEHLNVDQTSSLVGYLTSLREEIAKRDTESNDLLDRDR